MDEKIASKAQIIYSCVLVMDEKMGVKVVKLIINTQTNMKD